MWLKKTVPIIASFFLILMYQNCSNEFSAVEGHKSSTSSPGDEPTTGADNSPSIPDDSDNSDTLTYCPFEQPGGAPNDYEGKKVIRVCPTGDNRSGCHTNSIANAVSLAGNGDRIEIVKGTYNECATIPAGLSDLEITGVCGQPSIQNAVCQRKGNIVNYGTNLTLSNLEISGVAISAGDGGNGAALRDQGTGNTTLRFVFFHNNQNGVLGGSTGEFRIENSIFESNGSAVDPGYTHNIYISADVSHLIVNNSLFLRATYQGHNFKSRAKKTSINCTVSASLDGNASREFDISEGGDILISNSVVQQGAASSNSNIIGFGLENNASKAAGIKQNIHIKDSVLINDKGSGSFLHFRAFNNLTIQFENLSIIGPGNYLVKDNSSEPHTFDESNVNYFNSRANAGLPAASNDHTDLPKPSNCPNFDFY